MSDDSAAPSYARGGNADFEGWAGATLKYFKDGTHSHPNFFACFSYIHVLKFTEYIDYEIGISVESF